MSKIQIGHSKIQGKGLFATQAIVKGEELFKVKGPTIHYPTEPDYRVGANGLQIRKNVWRMPLRGNLWHFINHSCCPNVGILGTSTVVAARDIDSGEEITIDYSMVEAGRKWRMSCRCGEVECRGTIRGIQFLPRSFFYKHDLLISKYLRALYFTEKTYQLKERGVKKLLAKHPIKVGETIFTVEGPHVHYTFPPDYRIGYRWLAIGENRWISPLRNNAWAFIRHACEPNVVVDSHHRVIAISAIAPDEEITVDDAATEVDPRWKRICHCGLPACRGVVRSIQFLDARHYRKYEPYLPEFLKKSYQLSRK